VILMNFFKNQTSNAHKKYCGFTLFNFIFLISTNNNL